MPVATATLGSALAALGAKAVSASVDPASLLSVSSAGVAPAKGVGSVFFLTKAGKAAAASSLIAKGGGASTAMPVSSFVGGAKTAAATGSLKAAVAASPSGVATAGMGSAGKVSVSSLANGGAGGKATSLLAASQKVCLAKRKAKLIRGPGAAKLPKASSSTARTSVSSSSKTAASSSSKGASSAASKTTKSGGGSGHPSHHAEAKAASSSHKAGDNVKTSNSSDVQHASASKTHDLQSSSKASSHADSATISGRTGHSSSAPLPDKSAALPSASTGAESKSTITSSSPPSAGNESVGFRGSLKSEALQNPYGSNANATSPVSVDAYYGEEVSPDGYFAPLQNEGHFIQLHGGHATASTAAMSHQPSTPTVTTLGGASSLGADGQIHASDLAATIAAQQVPVGDGGAGTAGKEFLRGVLQSGFGVETPADGGWGGLAGGLVGSLAAKHPVSQHAASVLAASVPADSVSQGAEAIADIGEQVDPEMLGEVQEQIMIGALPWLLTKLGVSSKSKSFKQPEAANEKTRLCFSEASRRVELSSVSDRLASYAVFL